MRTILFFLACILVHYRISCQNIISDKTFKNWIQTPVQHKNLNMKYYLLLNPNAFCRACFKHQFDAIKSNEVLRHKICIVTTSDIATQFIKREIKDSLHFLLLDRNSFNHLSYLRYRNVLVRCNKNTLRLVLKLDSENAHLLEQHVLGD